MTPIELLTTRRSVKKLGLPAPSAAHIENMLQAATQVPDHGQLTPWRFVVMAGEAAQARLERALLQAAQTLGLGEEGEAKARQISHMAPLMIGVVAAPRLESSGYTGASDQGVSGEFGGGRHGVEGAPDDPSHPAWHG